MSGFWIRLNDVSVRCDRGSNDPILVARALTRLFSVPHFIPDCEQEPEELGLDNCECHSIGVRK